ncbi:Nn.00g071270.m01.CDS01 [Neocucurbitaria sp. VM-36]
MALQYLWFPLVLVYTFLTAVVHAASDCSASSADPIALIVSNYSIASASPSTFGIRIDAGNPKQKLVLTPSTVVDNTLLISTNICNNEAPQKMNQAQCRSYRGGTFDLTTAGASYHNLSTIGDLQADPGWIIFNTPYTMAGETDLGLVSNVAIPNMTVVVITEGANFSDGHLGLGKHSALLKQLKDSGIIPSLGFGLNAGSQSIEAPREGSLVLGGYDGSSVRGTFTNYPMDYPDTLARRYCPLQVQIQGLQLLLDGREPIQLIGEGDEHAACIEPYDNLFRLSESGLALFKQFTDWDAKTAYDSKDFYVPEPGLLYPSATGFNGSLRYSLSNGLTVDIPNSELQHPLRGLDQNGDFALQPNVTQLNVYGEALGAWVLGKVFLSQIYLAVDYDAQLIQLAEVNQNAGTPSPARFSSVSTGCPPKTKLAGGTIAAYVLGVIVGLALIGGAAYCLFRRRRRRAITQPSQISNTSESVSSPVGAGSNQLFTSGSPVNAFNGNLENRWELSGDRRTSELSSPNGGYPPPSPRDPASLSLHVSRSPDNVPTQESAFSDSTPRAQASQPWRS